MYNWMCIFVLTRGRVATRWLQTIYFIYFFMFVMSFVSTAKEVALKAMVQCKFVSDRSLSNHLLRTQVKGTNYALLFICRDLCNRRCVWLLFWRRE